MRVLDADYATISLYDDRVVLVETKAGVVVEATMVKRAMELIEQQIKGPYCVVIDRKNEYKLMRFEIYDEVNVRPKLLGIAIVTHSRAASLLTDLEIPLCRKPIAKFGNIDDAIAWAQGLHRQSWPDATTSRPSVPV